MHLKRLWLNTPNKDHKQTIDPIHVHIHKQDDRSVSFSCNDDILVTAELISFDSVTQRMKLRFEGAIVEVFVTHITHDSIQVAINDLHCEIADYPPQSEHNPQAGAQTASNQITAPMPGRVIRCLVEVGSIVQPKQPLLVIESMKIENEIHATHHGKIAAIMISEEQIVTTGELLITLDK